MADTDDRKEEAEQERRKTKMKKKILLIINCIMLAIGVCGGPLIARLYFIHGGHRVWLSASLQTAGFPLMLLPLAAMYIHRRRQSKTSAVISMNPRMFFAAAFVGILLGFDDYFYSYGVARLPVSTSSLILASQLVFVAVFAFLLVRQRFTAYTVNSVVLLTASAGVLAMHSSGDRPAGESTKQYVIGFVMTVAAAALYGLILPLVELVYKKTKEPATYSLVIEIQFVLCFSATLVCALGMIVNNDFKVIPREARDFELGESKYYGVVVASAILWQAFTLGAIGVIFCASSLLSGILIAVLLPVTEVLAVVFYKESFTAEKGVSLFLSIWGFVSYFYGEIKQAKEVKKNPETELPQTSVPDDL